jgi:hypothetical protein
MNALDLFSGTGSWKKVMNQLNYNVVSVDITDYNGRFKLTHKVDILKWNYKQYPNNYFKVISAGCPCIWYSLLQKTWIGRYKKNKTTKKKYLYTKELYEEDLEYADKLVKKTLEIIDYFKIGNPNLLWFIENPFSSVLKKREFMRDKPFYVVDYCSYGFYYKKRTIIFTNKKDFKPKLCKKQNCPAVVTFKDDKNKKRMLHICNCGNTFRRNLIKKHFEKLGNYKEMEDKIKSASNKFKRYMMPHDLVKELLS